MRLLLADDHAIVRDGLRWMLASEPDIDIVAEVADGQELVDEILERGDVDIVLLDVRMPGVGGLEALELLTSVHAPLPAIVVLSMHNEVGVVRRAIELGASGYVLKSSTRAELLGALRHVAAGDCYIQPELTAPLLHEVVERASSPGTRPALTTREIDVLTLVAKGLPNKHIGAHLGISEATVKTHLKAVFAQLHATNRTEAVAKGVELGLLER